MKVATHNGGFHADDVFAIAILKLIYSDLKVVRTRDPKDLQSVEMRVDVGGNYDPGTLDFDHHQESFQEKRENGIPYASAGLIWDHFGDKLVTNESVKEYIDKKIIQYVDANDEGISTYTVDVVEPYTISHFIKDLNPTGKERSEHFFDSRFNEAVSIIATLLERQIKKAEETIAARDILRKKIAESNGDYIVIEESMSWKETVINESDLKYVVLYDTVEKHWVVIAVPVSLHEFVNRKDLPKAWGGLFNKDLQKITGVADAKFCHKKLFIAIAKSKEGAIELVELALKHGTKK